MKLFQIEEPLGGPADEDALGAAIGIDARGERVAVAFSVGGNAEILRAPEGFLLSLAVPSLGALEEEWQRLFEAARTLAERALARPVSHAVIAFRGTDERAAKDCLSAAAKRAGLSALRFSRSLSAEEAAVLAEELMPRN